MDADTEKDEKSGQVSGAIAISEGLRNAALSNRRLLFFTFVRIANIPVRRLAFATEQALHGTVTLLSQASGNHLAVSKTASHSLTYSC